MKLPKNRQLALVLFVATSCLLLAALDVWLNFSGPRQIGFSNVKSSSAGLIISSDALDGQLKQTCNPTSLTNLCVEDRVIQIEGVTTDLWIQKLFSPFEIRPQWRPGQSVTYQVKRLGQLYLVEVTLQTFPLGTFLRFHWQYLLYFLFILSLAIFVLFQRPSDQAAQLLFGITTAIIAFQTEWFIGLHISDYINGVGLWLYILKVFPLIIFCTTSLHFVLVLTKSLPRSPWFLWLNYLTPFMGFLIGAVITLLTSPSLAVWLEWFYGDFSEILPPIYLGATLILFVYGYFRTDTLTRYRIRPVFLAGGSALFLSLFFIFLPKAIFHSPILQSENGLFFVLPFPFALAYAVLDRQLFGIEKIVIRALTYGLLISFSYLFSLALSFLFLLLGRVFLKPFFDSFPAEQVSQFMAFAIVILLVIPIREQAERITNKLIYGQGRANPYAILAQLDQTAKEHYVDETLLFTLAQTIAQAFRLPYVAIALKQSDEFEIVAYYGTSHTNSLFRTSLIYQAETIGHLLCDGRTPGEKLAVADQQLLGNFAAHIAVITHTRRVVRDLEQARQRIALVREQELRELRQRLHDVVGPEIAGMAYQIEAVRNILKGDTEAAETALAEIQTDFLNMLPRIRNLSYELLPPQSGLAQALDERINQSYPKQASGTSKPTILVSTQPDPLPTLPREVEMEALQIVLLALANVIRHAAANNCIIRLTLSAQPAISTSQLAGVDLTLPPAKQQLLVEVTDDGLGLPENYRPGVGLTSMRERAEGLGGKFKIGTRAEGGAYISVSLPCT